MYCHFAECNVLFIVMQIVALIKNTPSVSDTALKQSDIIMSVIVLSVIMLSTNVLSVTF
jgi:hypothetical protein